MTNQRLKMLRSHSLHRTAG